MIRHLRWGLPIIGATTLLGLAAPNAVNSMTTYAETHDLTPGPTLEAGKHHNDPINIKRRALQHEFAAERKARDKAEMKAFRRKVTHNADLSKNQQKAEIKAFAQEQRARDKQERQDEKQIIKGILASFTG